MLIKPFKKGFSNTTAAYYNTAGGGSTGLRTNMTGYWNLDTTSWLDSTGNGSTLTAAGTNAVTVSGVGPGGNNGAVFDGTNWLSCASNSHLISNNSDISVSGWVSGLGGPASSDIGFINKAAFGFTTNEWGFGSRFNGTFNEYLTSIQDQNSSTQSLGSGVNVTTGLIHIVMTWAAATFTEKLYVNGSLVSSNVFTGSIINSIGSANFNINVAAAGPTANGAANISLVGFWQGRVLSAGDASLLFNSGNGRTYAQTV